VDVFISYSHHDADVARTVASHLEARGHSPFIDYLGIRGGQEFANVIGQAIDASDAVVVLLSGDGIESQWVRWEIGWALKQRREIVPILLASISWTSIFPLASLHYLDLRDRSAANEVLRQLDDVLGSIPRRASTSSVLPDAVQARRESGAGDGLNAIPDEEVRRLATEALTARDEAPETAAFLGRLVLRQAPHYLGGWLRDFIEGVEADLRESRLGGLAERLQAVMDDDDLELGERIAQDMLFLDSDRRDALAALRHIRSRRQCDELYSLAARTTGDLALFLLSEVRRLSPDFEDRDNLLSSTTIAPAAVRLVRRVADVAPDVVHPHTHCRYAIAPAAGLVAVSEFYYRNQLRGDLVAVYRPGDEGSLAILEPASGAQGFDSSVTALALSPDGAAVAAGTRGGTVAIWKTGDPAEPVRLPIGGSVLGVEFAPAGDVLAVMTASYPPGQGSGPPTALSVWDWSNSRCLGRLPNEPPPKTMPDLGEWRVVWAARRGRVGFCGRAPVVAGIWDMYVRLWDYGRDEVVASLRTETTAHAVALENEQVVVAAGTTVNLFDREWLHGRVVAKETPSRELKRANDDRVEHVAFSPSGEILAVVGSSGRVDLCDPRTAELLQSVETGVHEPKTAKFSADGARLFIQHAVLGVGLDGPVALWPGS